MDAGALRIELLDELWKGIDGLVLLYRVRASLDVAHVEALQLLLQSRREKG